MWFVGLILGAIIGAVGGSEGAVGGAVVGTIIGAIIGMAKSSHARELTEQKLRDVEAALKRLEERINSLETSRPAPDAPLTQPAAATPEIVPPPAMPAEVPAPRSVDEASALPATSEMSPTPEPSPEPVPPKPPTPDEPSRIWKFLFGGNTLVRVGVLVLFFGVAFLLKYAAEHNYVPIELRLSGVAGGGIALLILGWRLRSNRRGYALALQGAGVGVLYLCIFAALQLYRLVPPGFAFVLLGGIAVLSALLAILQNAPALAVTGAVGGFLAPILASTGSGNHVGLFSFYAVLNAGILLVAYFKAWRILNLVGFAFTFIIGLAWGQKYYSPEFFPTTEPFLILFFVYYVGVAILFALRRAPQLTHYVDGTIVFGTPLVAFGLQTALVRDMEFGAAWSALGIAAIYLLLATALWNRKGGTLRLLAESFLALGVGFATLAIPLAFDARLTSATWAVEGAAAIWVGTRQGRRLPRALGLVLQFAAGIAFLADMNSPTGGTPVLNSFYMGCFMISVAGLFCAWYLEQFREQISNWEFALCRVLFVWGLVWWFGGGVTEIEHHVSDGPDWNAELLFFAGSCIAFTSLWRRLEWNIARLAGLAILPLMVVVTVGMALDRSVTHPFQYSSWMGWPIAFGTHLYALYRHEDKPDHGVDWLHTLGFWLFVIVAAWECGWQINHYVAGQPVWSLIAWAIVPGTVIAVFASHADRLGWPVGTHRAAYLHSGSLPVVVCLLAWIVYVNFRSDGDPAPLPYLPILNPLDLAQAGALLGMVTWYINVRRLDMATSALPNVATALAVVGGAIFTALNGVLLRTLHHYADVPFYFSAMMRSVLVQSSLSLFWSLLAVVTMFLSARAGKRRVWWVGAFLLGVVIVKLVLIDLSSTGTVERIVSFMGVGILTMAIGYFAPVPPKTGTIS